MARDPALPLADVQWILGHAHLATTQIYMNPSVEEAVAALACYVIDCASPDRARAIAGRVLDFHVTAIEVRPIHDSFGIGGT